MPSPPPCVGQFEIGDLTCNGDPDGADEEARTPCAWRNRCSGLQLYAQSSGFAPSEVVATLEYKTLVNICEKQVEDHDIRQGIPNGPEPESPDPEEDEPAEEQPEPSEAKPANRGKPPKRRTERRRVAPQTKAARKPKKAKPKPKPMMENGMGELRLHFETLLRDTFPDRRFAAGNRVLVKPGQFYELDRIKGSSYVSWYCTVPRGRDLAIACIRFKPRLGTVHVELPVAVEDMAGFLTDEVMGKLDPQPHKDGQFLSVCKNLKAEGVGLVVEALKTLIETDLIALP